MLVITPHSRLKLGPTQALQVFLEQQVMWLNLEDLSQQPDLDPLLNLLTLPVRPESELAASSQQILASRPDLDTVVLPMLVFPSSPRLSHPEGRNHGDSRHPPRRNPPNAGCSGLACRRPTGGKSQ